MILSIGNINLDWICTLSHLPVPDEKVNIHKFKIHPGGAASNFAASLARLGTNIAIFGHVGDDTEGHEALKTLKQEGVDTSRVIIEKDLATGFVIILLDKNGQSIKLRFRGANSRLSPDDLTPKLVEGIDIAYAASVTIPIANQLAKTCKDVGVRSSLDVGEDIAKQSIDVFRKMIRNFSIVFINEIVFERIFNEPPTLSNVQSEIEGNLEVLSVTLGRKGSITASRETSFHTPTFDVEVVDTTGAGDAYAAGFIHFYQQHLPLEEVVKRSNACASLQIMQPGARAGLPTAGEVEEFIKTYESKK
ncbi:MAG: carbohydrate kinase family protein [Promethearchaeota archaeon]